MLVSGLPLCDIVAIAGVLHVAAPSSFYNVTAPQLSSKVLPAAFYYSDVPTNPRIPAKLIRNISNVIDTALGDVDGILNKVR